RQAITPLLELQVEGSYETPFSTVSPSPKNSRYLSKCLTLLMGFFTMPAISHANEFEGTNMKTIVSIGVVLIFVALAGIAQQQVAVEQQSSSETAPKVPYRIVGTMSQLMVDIIFPTSDDLFYIVRKPPSNDAEWGAIERS